MAVPHYVPQYSHKLTHSRPGNLQCKQSYLIVWGVSIYWHHSGLILQSLVGRTASCLATKMLRGSVAINDGI